MPKSSVSPKAQSPRGREPKSGWDKISNYLRTCLFVVFIFTAIFFISYSWGAAASTLQEVAITDVIARANDPEGDIKSIVVKENELTITLKGKDHPTQKSRKDASGTLAEQGLIDYCVNIENAEARKQCY